MFSATFTSICNYNKFINFEFEFEFEFLCLGITVGAVGGATGLGAALTDLGITLRNAKTAERMLKEDRKNTGQIHDLVNGIET